MSECMPVALAKGIAGSGPVQRKPGSTFAVRGDNPCNLTITILAVRYGEPAFQHGK